MSSNRNILRNKRGKRSSMKSVDDSIFNSAVMVITVSFFLIIAVPLIYVVSSSFSDADAVITGKVFLWPVDPTLEGYIHILEYKPIWIGYRNTVMYTVVGTSVNLVVTLLAAYALSRKELMGRGFFTFLFAFTMFFSGGLIPLYMVVKQLTLLNKMWALILPYACNVYNIVIARTYFQTSIPEELREAAMIDGCTNVRLFLKIILPLAKPIIVVLILFYAVGHWNSFFSALIYISDIDKMPLQIFLRNILLLDQFTDLAGLDAESYAYLSYLVRLKESMKFGIIVVSTLPLLILCSSMQKFFVKGMMIGAIKG